MACATIGISTLIFLAQEIISKRRKTNWNTQPIHDEKAVTTQELLNTQATNFSQITERNSKKAVAWITPHFSFQGTATRKQFILTQVIAGIVLGFVLAIGGSMYDSVNDLTRALGILLMAAAICVACWLRWAVSARRVRDTEVTVWWVLTLLIPPLNLATFVFLLLVPTNEFQGRGL